MTNEFSLETIPNQAAPIRTLCYDLVRDLSGIINSLKSHLPKGAPNP